MGGFLGNFFIKNMFLQRGGILSDFQGGCYPQFSREGGGVVP